MQRRGDSRAGDPLRRDAEAVLSRISAKIQVEVLEQTEP